MIHFSDFSGVIFDVDDTLLDNQPPGEDMGLHERSRLIAAHEVGRRHGIASLQQLTPLQSKQAFATAKVHTVYVTVWQMLVIARVVSADEEPNINHPLVQEIVNLKEDLHEDILRTKGREVPGARAFVELLAQNGLSGKLAIASTACQRDIDVFFAMSGLDQFFPDNMIISRDRFTFAKPDPEPFNLAFAALGLPEENRASVLAFEDDPRGVLSAKTAGLYTCAITSRHTREALAALETPPNLIADSYEEFTRLFGLSAPSTSVTTQPDAII